MSVRPHLSKELLDDIAFTAYLAVIRDGVEKSQVNKLIEMLESMGKVDYLLAFIARQSGRGVWGRRGSHYSASRLFNVLKGKSVDEAREVLGLFKWLYEAGSNKYQRLRALRVQQTAGPPKGFFYTYLEAVLR